MNFCLVPLEKGDDNKVLFGVFDGHAGKEAAQEAVSQFPKV
jgi:serine/threonine protein phosphatase PrpC